MGTVNLAGFGKRFVAYIIDFILLGFALTLVLLPFGGILAFIGLGAVGSNADLSEGETAAWASMAGLSIGGLVLISLAIPVIYDALMTASVRQGTVGKMAMKIKVVKENGETLSTSEAFIRAILKSVTGGACLFLWLVCLFNKQEQNLHDMASSALVVSAE